jgi:hypothetical protein
MFKKLLFDYLHTGTRKRFNPEANRKIFTVNLFGLVGLSLTALMGFNALFEQRFILSGVLFLPAPSITLDITIKKLRATTS